MTLASAAYEVDQGVLPYVRDGGWPVTVYWFGVVTSNTASPYQPLATTPAGGVLSPYYENNGKVQRCPDFLTPPVGTQYGGFTGGYAMNPAMGDAAWNGSGFVVKTHRMAEFQATSATSSSATAAG